MIPTNDECSPQRLAGGRQMSFNADKKREHESKILEARANLISLRRGD